METFNESSLDLINQGYTLMAVENYEEAAKVFEQAVHESPRYIECYVNLGNAYASLGKYDEAIETYKKGMILDSKNVEILFGMGNLMYLQDKLLEAIKYYNKAEETNNMTAEMYDVIADIFQANDDYVQAIRYINKAIELEPLNGNYYLEKTKIFIDQQKVNEAIETLNELNAILPDAYEAYDMLSEIYIIKEDFKNAIDTVNKAVDRFPDDPSIAYLKLKVLVKFQKDEEAKAFISKMKEAGLYDSVKEENSLLEADILLRSNKLLDAAQCLENASDEKYSNGKIDFILINIYMTIGKYLDVEKITSCMLENQDDIFYDSTARFYHAESLKLQNKQEVSLKEFKETAKKIRSYTIVDSSFYQGYIYRSLCHKELQEYDEALRLTDYMINVFPGRVDGYAIKYAIFKEQGDEENSIKALEKIKEIDPTFKS